MAARPELSFPLKKTQQMKRPSGASSFLFRRLWRSFPALYARAHIAWFPVGGCAQDCMWIFRKPQNTPNTPKGRYAQDCQCGVWLRHGLQFRSLRSLRLPVPSWALRAGRQHGNLESTEHTENKEKGVLVKFFVSFVPLSPHPFVPYVSPLVNNQPQASKANEQLTANSKRLTFN